MRFRLFNPRKSNSAVSDRIAAKSAKGILLVQKKWANGMSKLAAKVSVKTQRIVFAGFAFVMTCHFTWLIYSAINNLSAPLDTHHKIALPVTLKPDTDLDTYNQRELARKKNVFQRYADSIKQKGGPGWEQFRQQNGLLFDSLNHKR